VAPADATARSARSQPDKQDVPSVHNPPATVVLVRPTTDAVIALEVLLPGGAATQAVLVGEGGVL
jgi:hypothetical protein